MDATPSGPLDYSMASQPMDLSIPPPPMAASSPYGNLTPPMQTPVMLPTPTSPINDGAFMMFQDEYDYEAVVYEDPPSEGSEAEGIPYVEDNAVDYYGEEEHHHEEEVKEADEDNAVEIPRCGGDGDNANDEEERESHAGVRNDNELLENEVEDISDESLGRTQAGVQTEERNTTIMIPTTSEVARFMASNDNDDEQEEGDQPASQAKEEYKNVDLDAGDEDAEIISISSSLDQVIERMVDSPGEGSNFSRVNNSQRSIVDNNNNNS